MYSICFLAFIFFFHCLFNILDRFFISDTNTLDTVPFVKSSRSNCFHSSFGVNQLEVQLCSFIFLATAAHTLLLFQTVFLNCYIKRYVHVLLIIIKLMDSASFVSAPGCCNDSLYGHWSHVRPNLNDWFWHCHKARCVCSISWEGMKDNMHCFSCVYVCVCLSFFDTPDMYRITKLLCLL